VLLPDDVRARLEAETARLRPLAREVAWVAPANLHVTLKFLGQVDEGRVGALVEALGRAAAESAPFALALAGLGAFPSVTRPRVLWAGATDGAPALASLAARVDGALADLGVERETRAFTAHVTLGRVRAPGRNPALAAALAAAAATPFGRVAVERIALMRSDLGPKGARHTPLGSLVLGARVGSTL
jgi:2'-5' RNA ligase